MHFASERLNPSPSELSAFLARFPPRDFDRGQVLVHEAGRGGGPPSTGPVLGHVVEGLVWGVWRGGGGGGRARMTAVVAGDGRWFGLDAFHHGENIYRYEAAAPTVASLVPLDRFCAEAPRSVLLGALAGAGMEWCTAAALAGIHGGTLRRRTLLLLYERVRLHPRPELEMRQQDLADLLGVTRQTLHPVLKELEEAGLLELGYAEIVVGEADSLLGELEGGGVGPPKRG